MKITYLRNEFRNLISEEEIRKIGAKLCVLYSNAFKNVYISYEHLFFVSEFENMEYSMKENTVIKLRDLEIYDGCAVIKKELFNEKWEQSCLWCDCYNKVILKTEPFSTNLVHNKIFVQESDTDECKLYGLDGKEIELKCAIDIVRTIRLGSSPLLALRSKDTRWFAVFDVIKGVLVSDFIYIPYYTAENIILKIGDKLVKLANNMTR